MDVGTRFGGPTPDRRHAETGGRVRSARRRTSCTISSGPEADKDAEACAATGRGVGPGPAEGPATAATAGDAKSGSGAGPGNSSSVFTPAASVPTSNRRSPARTRCSTLGPTSKEATTVRDVSPVAGGDFVATQRATRMHSPQTTTKPIPNFTREAAIPVAAGGSRGRGGVFPATGGEIGPVGGDEAAAGGCSAWVRGASRVGVDHRRGSVATIGRANPTATITSPAPIQAGDTFGRGLGGNAGGVMGPVRRRGRVSAGSSAAAGVDLGLILSAVRLKVAARHFVKFFT